MKLQNGINLRLLEDDADALKHAEVLTIYKILYIYCSFVGLDNKLYKMHGTYIKISDVGFNLGKFILLQMRYAGKQDISPTCLPYVLHAYCSEYLVCSAKRQTSSDYKGSQISLSRSVTF